jgi:hypothetical protein
MAADILQFNRNADKIKYDDKEREEEIEKFSNHLCDTLLETMHFWDLGGGAEWDKLEIALTGIGRMINRLDLASEQKTGEKLFKKFLIEWLTCRDKG